MTHPVATKLEDYHCYCDLAQCPICDAIASLRELSRWKVEATEVLAGWERVWEALGKPGVVGSLKTEASLAEVERLRAGAR